MQSTSKIVVSGALMLTAINAMASVPNKISIESDDEGISPDMRQAIDAAMGRKATVDRINTVFGTLASIIKDGDQTIAEKHLRGDKNLLLAWATDDSTISDVNGCYTNCYNNCHNACHSACHGSRGWR